MPFPLSHLVYADRILKNRLINREISETKFLVGATFLDIRYLLKIKKEETHLNYKDSSEVLKLMEKENDSFELGILTHIYTDCKFVEYWLEYLNNHEDSYYPILLVENQNLFKYKKDDWVKMFEVVNNEEIGRYDASEEIVRCWHELMTVWIGVNMDKKIFWNVSVNIFGANNEWVKKIWNKYQEIRYGQEIQERIEVFYNDF